MHCVRLHLNYARFYSTLLSHIQPVEVLFVRYIMICVERLCHSNVFQINIYIGEKAKRRQKMQTNME